MSRSRSGWARALQAAWPLLVAVGLAGSVAAQPAAGTLVISATAPGVEVWLGERKLGTVEARAPLVLRDLPPGPQPVVGRKAARRWERTVEVVANAETSVSIDIDLASPAGDLGLTREVLGRIERQHLRPPDFAALRLGALRGLEKAVREGRLAVTDAPDGVTLAYRLPKEPLTRIVFAGGGDREDAVQDIASAYTLARLVGAGPDATALEHAMLRGMLRGLDPHSAFLDPHDFREAKVGTSGRYGGVGLEVTIRNDQFTVIAPIEGTPAWRAGMQPGDQVLQIDGQPTKGLTMAEATRRMRGPKGTRVSLTIARDGLEQPLEVTLTREIIQLQSVKARTIEPGIGYVRVRHFQERTGSDLEAALRELERTGRLAGLVLDLRNNPGGLLSAAVAVAEQFLPEGSLVTYTEGRARGRNMRFVAHAARSLTDVPLIVLVNKGSASASEIVAAAVQDHGRALVAGQPTFGKGTVQSLIALQGGSGLRLTTARYLTPKDRSIDASGVRPDLWLEPGAPAPPAGGEGPDFQLQRALVRLRAVIDAEGRQERARTGGPRETGSPRPVAPAPAER